VAKSAALEAGRVLLDYFNRATTVTWKGKSNIATDADLASEKVVIETLTGEFPGHDIVGEESGSSGQKSEYTWLVDPLDGTNNFLAGIPHFCTTMSLTRNGEILLGVTYDPLRQELFHSAQGVPAFLNDQVITASRTETMEASLIGFDVGYNLEEGPRMLGMAESLWKDVHGLRLMGSAAMGLAYVAAGRMELYCHRFLYPWDIAAGILLVRNAGGVVTDWDGAPATPDSRQIVAGGPKLNSLFREWCRSRSSLSAGKETFLRTDSLVAPHETFHPTEGLFDVRH